MERVASVHITTGAAFVAFLANINHLLPGFLYDRVEDSQAQEWFEMYVACLNLFVSTLQYSDIQLPEETTREWRLQLAECLDSLDIECVREQALTEFSDVSIVFFRHAQRYFPIFWRSCQELSPESYPDESIEALTKLAIGTVNAVLFRRAGTFMPLYREDTPRMRPAKSTGSACSSQRSKQVH